MFSAYFESLGIPAENLVYSDYTSEELYKAGAKRGSIDPCFPSKVGIPHVHNLLYVHHKKKPLDLIFFPMIDDLPSDLVNAQSHRACPTVTATPAADQGGLHQGKRPLQGDGRRVPEPAHQLRHARSFSSARCSRPSSDILGLSPEENHRATRRSHEGHGRISPRASCASRAAKSCASSKPKTASASSCWRGPITTIPGLNHDILEEFQKLGYPVLTQASLPIDDEIIWKLFGDEVRAGVITHPMDITDAWKNSYSENTSQKVWAAKYTARHPNLVALELSSFKCGHDAPIYTVVEETVTKSGTPYFSFKDIDENKPSGSIRIRVETISYFLKRYREDMIASKRKESEIDVKLAEFEAQAARRIGRAPGGNGESAGLETEREELQAV